MLGILQKNKFSVGCHQFLLECCPKLIKTYNFAQRAVNKRQLKNKNEQFCAVRLFIFRVAKTFCPWLLVFYRVKKDIFMLHGKKTWRFWVVYRLDILADIWKKKFFETLRITVDCGTFLSIFSVLFIQSPISIIFEFPEWVFVWNCAYCSKVLVDDHWRQFFLPCHNPFKVPMPFGH